MALKNSLDDLLARGYFRAGHTLRQTRYVYVDGVMYPTVWSRVNLQDYALSKSQRRLYRRVASRYELRIGPYRSRGDQDELYERYQAAHPLEVGESIADIFGHHSPVLDFKTHAARLERDGRLVAFSCFDIGETTIASLFGCYEPSYARESLGFASMLFEMAYGRERGLRYYYPGYCVPGLAPFAYKQRLPALEGLTYRRKAWAPLPEVLAGPLPKAEIEARLARLTPLLTARGIAFRPLLLPLADSLPSAPSLTGPLPHPIMLSVVIHVPLGEVFVGYDLTEETYEIWLAGAQVDLALDPHMVALFTDFPPDADLRLFGWRVPLFTSPDPEAIAGYLKPEPGAGAVGIAT